MTNLLGLSPYQSEALIVCLAASVVWAGALFVGAIHLERRAGARVELTAILAPNRLATALSSER